MRVGDVEVPHRQLADPVDSFSGPSVVCLVRMAATGQYLEPYRSPLGQVVLSVLLISEAMARPASVPATAQPSLASSRPDAIASRSAAWSRSFWSA